MIRVVSFLTIFFMVTSGARADDGRLEAVRQEVRQPQSTPDSNSSSSSSSCSDDELDGLFGELFLHILAAPFTLPHSALGDDFHTPSTFVAYPYADGWGGLVQPGLDSHQREGGAPASWEHLFSFRAAVEEGNDFNGLNRLGVTFLADSFLRFGVGGGVHYFEEKRPAGSPDQLTIGDINLLFRFAQSERAQYRAGLGARFLEDCRQTDWGFNFVYGMDYFPMAPLSFGMQVETGTLGSAWVFRAQGRLGMVWKYSEIYLGYDYLRIGQVDLHGPMVGVRLWF